MRHFTAFLNQVREMKEAASDIEPNLHYARLDAILNTLGMTQHTLTYRELGKVMGVFSAKLAAILGRRMEDDHANGEPLSSALIVNRATGISSQGFFDKARSLGYEFEDEKVFWEDMADRCHAKFEEHAQVGMALTQGLTDDEQEMAEKIDTELTKLLFAQGIDERPWWRIQTATGKRAVQLCLSKGAIVAIDATAFAKMDAAKVLEIIKKNIVNWR